MSAHTPGPWFYGIAYEGERGPVPFDYKSPAYSQNAGIIGAGGQTTVVGCDEYHVFNSEADARLIAAAPDMYEVLTWCATHAGIGDPLKSQILAVLAKAEGRS